MPLTLFKFHADKLNQLIIDEDVALFFKDKGLNSYTVNQDLITVGQNIININNALGSDFEMIYSSSTEIILRNKRACAGRVNQSKFEPFKACDILQDQLRFAINKVNPNIKGGYTLCSCDGDSGCEITLSL